jgi:hypothetical protein
VEVQVTVADFHGNGVSAVAGPAIVDAVIRVIPATIHLRRAMDDLQESE